MTDRILRNEWELAGITGETGTLGRPLDASQLPVPATVETDGEMLVWWGVSPGLELTVPAGRRMLDEFVKLADAPARRIRDYARRWGVLHICEHGLPASHVSDSYSWRLYKNVERCLPLGWPGIPEGVDLPDKDEEMEKLFGGREPVERWRAYSRQAQAALNVVAMLYQDKRGRAEDWRALAEGDQDLAKADLNIQLETLTLFAKGWLLLGNVRPDMILHPAGRGSRRLPAPRVTLGGCSPAWGHLFGALACQLMFAVTRTEGLAVCTACADTYIPTRKPQAGRRSFCDPCRERGEPLRYASADYRERKARNRGGGKRKR